MYKIFNYFQDLYLIQTGKNKAKYLMKKFDMETDFEFKSKGTKDLIVSLTTIPYRLNNSYYSIVSAIKQTVKPERIILTLDERRKGEYIFSKQFEKLIDAGLEIIYRDDIRCHTKYYYSILENPGKIVITIDDDCIYDNRLFEKLYQSYKTYPTAISCMRARKIQYTEDGKIKKYNDWPKCGNTMADIPQENIMATGVGGVLYPPYVFDAETFNKGRINELCLNADDIWLYFMERRCGTKICKVKGKSQMYVDIPDTQTMALQKENVIGERNDQYIQNLLDFYGPLDKYS